MKTFKFPAAVLLLAASISIPASAQVDNQRDAATLGSPALALQRRVVFDSEPFSAGSVIPTWDKGYLVSITPELFSPSSSNIRLYDASGNKVREATIWFPDAEKVGILTAGILPDGNLIASGTAVKSDGTRAYFIAQADHGGKLVSVLRTNPFFPLFVCSTPEGKIWSFGGSGVERQKDAQLPDSGLVRQFDLEKGQIASYLPQSAFGDGTQRPAFRGKDGEEAYLGCTSDQLMIYSGKVHEFVVFDLKSRSAQKFKIDTSSVSPVRSFAVTSGGEVFGYLADFLDAKRPRGLFHLKVNRANDSAQWEPVDGASGLADQPGVINGLWGAEGNTLVYGRHDDPAGRHAVLWSPVLSRLSN